MLFTVACPRNPTEVLVMAKPHARRRRSDEVDAPDQEIHVEVAQMIQSARREAGLTQAELALRIGTHQQAIARLEDPDYDGHSVRLLYRLARALRLRLSIKFAVPQEVE
jgi:ribosome-binding protein aMBF1 (putative translation factor)